MFPTTIQSMDFSKSEQSILSIRITTGGFYFSIHNPYKDTPYTFFKSDIDRKKSIVSNFKELVSNNPFLCQLYKKVNIIVSNTRTVIHPLHLFDPESCKQLYYIGQKLNSTTTEVQYNILEQNNQVVLFGVNNILYKFLTEHFSNPNIYAQTSCLLNVFYSKSCKANCKSLYVYFEDNTMQILAYNYDKLLLNNFFQVDELNNQIYYILYIWKQLKFSQEKDDLYLAGNLSDKKELIELVKKYIVSVNPMKDSEYIDLKNLNL